MTIFYNVSLEEEVLQDVENVIGITEEEIQNFVDIEMQEGSHEDYLKDYDCPLDFYLSCVREDDYITYIKESLSNKNLNNGLAIIIKDEIERRIKELV